MKKCIRLGARARQRICRVAAWLLVAVMLAGILPQGVTTAEAATTVKRTIGIVFDNSGSMYSDETWCRAIYAMEVFASMANDGDEIIIYPMWYIQVEDGGTKYTSDDNPLEICIGDGNASGGVYSDPAIIRQIYTPTAKTTPIETIEDAYDDLKDRDGETWLIVLTDGTSFYEDGVELGNTTQELSELLSECNEEMNVLYMGIGSGAVEPEISNSSGYIHDVQKVTDSNEVLKTLSAMCNTIYGRDVINTSGDEVTFDVSMSKLILFIQGKDIQNVKLYDSDGNEISSTKVYEPSYATKGAEGKNNTPDTSLSGTVATFEDLDAGTYTFDYEGTMTSIAAYYEPDVELKVWLTNAEGSEVSANDEISAGTYYLNYALVDKYGEETSSALLGTPYFTGTYTVGDTTEDLTPAKANGSEEITLPEDVDLSASVQVTYLNNYELAVSTEDGTISMPTHVEVNPAYALTVSLSGGESSYPVKDLEDEAVYTVTVAYNGETLTGAELATVDLTAALDDTGDTAPVAECELSSDGASYTVSLKYPSGGASAVEAKDYTLEVNATYVEEKGREVVADTVEKSFTVEAYKYGLAASLDASSYYSIYEMNSEDGQTVTVNVTRDGEALTAEEMAQTELEFDADGLEYTVEKDAENSCFVVTLKGEDADGEEVETGDYTLTATVSSVDELGNTVTATAEKSTSVGLVPKWMMVLAGILVLAILAILIWLYMNMKVLPKNIRVENVKFGKGRNDIGGGVAGISYNGAKKKNGRLTIQTPEYNGTPAASCTFNFTLEAVSPRHVKSSERVAKVVSADVSASGSIKEVEFDSSKYQSMEKYGVLYLNKDREQPMTDIKDQDVTLTGTSHLKVTVEEEENVSKGFVFYVDLVFD